MEELQSHIMMERRLEFLDETGKVTYSLPQGSKSAK
jgi:hypothetical protein